jgi:hypothetical protein
MEVLHCVEYGYANILLFPLCKKLIENPSAMKG